MTGLKGDAGLPGRDGFEGIKGERGPSGLPGAMGFKGKNEFQLWSRYWLTNSNFSLQLKGNKLIHHD